MRNQGMAALVRVFMVRLDPEGGPEFGERPP